MENQEAQLLLAQALRAAGGADTEFPAFWRSIDSEAKEYVADVTAKALVAFVATRSQGTGRSAQQAVDDFCRSIATGGLQIPTPDRSRGGSS